MTQAQKILTALEHAGPAGLTGLDLLEKCGSYRAAARIAELREAGHPIETVTHRTVNGARVARYVLHQTDQLFATNPRPSSAHYLTESA